MTSGLEHLRAHHRWPERRPNLPSDEHGWFGDDHREVLGKFLDGDTRLVVELGAWLGKSTRWILDHAPNAAVLSVDTWEGGPEHQDGRVAEWSERLPTLYETFLVNCWAYRERLVPLRMTTTEGLLAIHYAGVSPDVIYIDADHRYESVKEDIETCERLFPNTQMVGDDIKWPGVQRALRELLSQHGGRIGYVDNAWWWDRHARRR